MKKYSFLNYLKQIVAFATLFAVLSNTTLAATYYVDRNDGADTGGICNDLGLGDCSIFDALRLANVAGAQDTITGELGTITITPAAGLTISSNVIIDSNSSRRLVLDGAGGSFSALTLGAGSDGSQVKGMYIYGFSGVNGIGIDVASGVDNVTIGGSLAEDGNIIGLMTDAGETINANKTGIRSAGTNVLIGRNFVSGNNENGILINGGTNIDIHKNTIGLGTNGADKGNARNGIYATGTVEAPLNLTGSGLQIGGAGSLDEGNIISGNGWYGVAIGAGNGDVNGTAKIQGNYIGVDGSGVAKANDLGGITVANDADGLNLTVGTDGDGLSDDATEGNVVSSNGTNITDAGIYIAEGGNVIIAGNDIGLLAGGEASGNTGVGIKVGAVGMGGPTTLRIGTDNNDANEGNNIGSNTVGGVLVENATTIDINGNRIGMDSSGSARSNTGGAALKINAAQATTVNIGMADTTAFVTNGSNYIGNSPAGNTGALIVENTANGANVEIKSNWIGLGTDGSTVETNATNGMYLTAPANYIIGTDLDTVNDTYERNYIANSGSNGIYVGSGPLSVIISGVTMGLARSGFNYTVTAPNGANLEVGSQDGVKIASNSLTSFAFGGAAAAQRNIIASSLGNGLFIGDVGAAIDFTIRNSIFGFGSDLTTERDNTLSGISIAEGGAVSLIDNVVANSNADAISLTGGTSYTITGNKIGTGATGLVSHTNGGDGLVLNSVSITSAVIGGATAALANVIASSIGDGIYIATLATANTPVTIQGNYIGVCADPTGKGTIATDNLADCDNAPAGIQVNTGDVTIGGGAGNTIETDGLLGTGNVISNNGLYGIAVGSSGVMTISGNIIGLIKSTIDDPYNVEASNGSAGIMANAGTPTLTIGGTGGVNVSSNRNIIISGSTGAAVSITSLSNPVATIINNYINTDFTGATAVSGGQGGISIDGGSTITIGGIGSNEGNLIQGAFSSAAVNLLSNFVGTINLYKNIIGLNAAGTAALGGDQLGLSFEAAGSTVNIGDGTAAGRNVIAGNTLYGIYISAATAVNVLGNYIGVASDGTTSVPNATDSATLLAMPMPVVEMYFTAISGALTVSGNTINNSTHVGAYYLDETPTNEITMTADNPTVTSNAHTVPTYNFWQRYSGATLAAFGPNACDDGYDNDSDGVIDFPADAGCSSSADTDETNLVACNDGADNDSDGVIDYPADTGCSSALDTDETDPVVAPVGGGSGGALIPSSSRSTPTPTPTPSTPTPAPDSTPDSTPPATTEPALTTTEQNVKDFVIAQKLNESVNVVTNKVFGNAELSDALLVDLANEKPAVETPDTKLTSDQKEVKDGLEQLTEGKPLTVAETKAIEVIVQTQIQNAAESFSKKVEAGTVSGANLQVVSSGGGTKTITKKTKFVFALDKIKAAELDKNADADTIVVDSSTIIGNNKVSALVSLINGGEIGDPDAAEKLFFGGLKGLAAEKVVTPDQAKATNFEDGAKVAPKFLMWVAGPKAGEKVSIFAIDKKGSNDPKVWQTIKLGNYQLDEKKKTAVEIDLSAYMTEDLKNFTIIVQDESGKGTYSNLIVDNKQEMKMDKVEVKDSKQIVSANLTGNMAKLAAAEVNNDDKKLKEGTLSGYAEPGSVVFVTWKSVLTTSTVIADASQGYFEVQIPKELESGAHTAYTYSYNQTNKTASSFAKLMFSKFL